MKITKDKLKQIIKEELDTAIQQIDEEVGNVEQIIAEGRAFFDKVIQLSIDSETNPAAQAALEQIADKLSPEIEEKSYGYVKLVIIQ
jgi:hypothetical protein